MKKKTEKPAIDQITNEIAKGVAGNLDTLATSLADTRESSKALSKLNDAIDSLMETEGLTRIQKGSLIKQIIVAQATESLSGRRAKVIGYCIAACLAAFLVVVATAGTIFGLHLQQQNTDAVAKAKTAEARLPGLESQIDELKRERGEAAALATTARKDADSAAAETKAAQAEKAKTEAQVVWERKSLDEAKRENATLKARAAKWVCVIDTNRNESDSVMRQITDKIRAKANVDDMSINVDQEPIPFSKVDVPRREFGRDIEYIAKRRPDVIIVHWHALRARKEETENAEEALLKQLSVLWPAGDSRKPPHVFIYSRERPFSEESFLGIAGELEKRVPQKAAQMRKDFTVVPVSDASMNSNLDDLTTLVFTHLNKK